MRSSRDEFKIDNCGFEMIDHVSGVKNFADEEEIKKVYYPEVKGMIKKV
jgi:hypothetical protein